MSSIQLTINQFESLHGRRQPAPTVYSELSSQMSDRSKADKLRKMALATPLKRFANFIDHVVGSDTRHKQRWVDSHGAHIIERASVAAPLHRTSLLNLLRRKPRDEYLKLLEDDRPESFWETDRRPSWRAARAPEFSKAEMMFSLYRSTATYLASKTRNTRVLTRYYLICDDIVNFMVMREWSKSTPTDLRDRMWHLWGMSHPFNIPVELELPLIKNCIEVAIFLILAYTQEEIIDDREVIVIDEVARATCIETITDVYTPKFRFKEQYSHTDESMLRRLDNRKKPARVNVVDDATAKAEILPPLVEALSVMMPDFEELSTLEGLDISDDEEFDDIVVDPKLSSGQQTGVVSTCSKTQTDTVSTNSTTQSDTVSETKSKRAIAKDCFVRTPQRSLESSINSAIVIENNDNTPPNVGGDHI